MSDAEFYECQAKFISGGNLDALKELTKFKTYRFDEDSFHLVAKQCFQLLKNFKSSCDDELVVCEFILAAFVESESHINLFSILDLAINRFSRNLETADKTSASMKNCASSLVVLSQQHRISEHMCYHLVTVSLKYAFLNLKAEPSMCRVLTKLAATLFSDLPANQKSGLLENILEIWTQSRFKGSVLCGCLLELVQSSGTLRLQAFIDSKQLQTRTLIEKQAVKATHDAEILANHLVRLILQRAQQAKQQSDFLAMDLHGFTETLVNQVFELVYPASELLLRVWTVHLVNMLRIAGQQRYPNFAFKQLDLIAPCLQRISSESKDPEFAKFDALQTVISQAPSIDSALYMATQQLTRTPEFHYDLTDTLTNFSSTSAKPLPHVAIWLSQTQTPELYDKLMRVFEIMADNTLLKEKFQVELFKLIAKIAPSMFKLEWLGRLNSVSSSVAEPLVSLAIKAGDLELVFKELKQRMLAPGSVGFKRTVLENTPVIDSLEVWSCILASCCDYEESVQTQAVKAGMKLVEAGFWQSLLAAYTARPEYLRGVSLILRECDNKLIKTLVSDFVENDLELAALIVESRPECFAIAKMPILLEKMQADGAQMVPCLRILRALFQARPRFLLPFKTLDHLFKWLTDYLKLAQPTEIEHLAVILNELVQLGSAQDQKQRQMRLMGILKSSFIKIQQNVAPPVKIQLVLILGCLKFWSSNEQLATGVATYLANIPCETDSTLKLAIIRSCFQISSKFPTLFSAAPINKLFNQTHDHLSESQLFTKLLFANLSEPHAPSRQLSMQEKFLGERKPEAKLSHAVLSGHLTSVLDGILKTQDYIALTTLVKAVQKRLVVVDKCFPVLLALSFSDLPAISQTSRRVYETLALNSPTLVTNKFTQGVELATSTFKSKCNSRILAKLLGTLPERVLRPTIVKLSESLNVNQPVDHIRVCLVGLQQISMTQSSAKLVIAALDQNTQLLPPHLTTEEQSSAVLLTLLALYLRKKHALSVYDKHLKPQPDLEVFDPAIVCDNCAKLGVNHVFAKLRQLPDSFDHPEVQKLVSVSEKDHEWEYEYVNKRQRT